jgi:hypothetical protein
MPWWRTDTYDQEEALPGVFDTQSGPNGVALVKAWPDGRTDHGWGLQGSEGRDGFIPKYGRDEFNSRRVLYGYHKGRWAFAIIMRSVRMVCIDIDGKNGGLEHAKRLGMLPPTLAETSKSGNGFHLFYTVADDWKPDKGFAKLGDRIGIEQGVDIRATGCVYHHAQQRWNGRLLAPLPDHLYQVLHAREQKVAATTQRIAAVLDSGDELEIMMMQSELISELKKPIPQGKRNNTLFAIGTQMKEAGVPLWQEPLSDRANELGLDGDEIAKLVSNIEKYGVAP